MKPTRIGMLGLCLALVVPPIVGAWAEEGPLVGDDAKPAPGALEARAALEKYLGAVKAKKWAEAKKSLHPQTLAAIAERKKRLGREDHPMAPWTYEKSESYLKDFRIQAVAPAHGGTFVASVSEDNYQVQEKGIAEGEPAAYLLGKRDGRWFIADKKRGEGFTDASIKVGYKGYFDPASP